MKERTIDIFHFLLAAAIAVAFGLWSAHHFRYEAPADPEVIVRVDTLVMHDTLVTIKPVPYNVYVVDTLYYPVPVPGQHDTVWAALPWEEKEYQDSTYRAVVEGFRPSLKEIEVYRQKQVVTVTNTVQLPPPRWSWGVQAGLGASKDGLTPYVGIGIQYRLSFRK